MTAVIQACSDGTAAGNTLTAGATEYWPPGNSWMARNTTENTRQVPWRTAGTISRCRAIVISNSAPATSSINLRQNSASAVTLSIGAGATGEIVDTSFVTITAGDLVDWQSVAAASGTVAFASWSFLFHTSANVAHTRLVTRIGTAFTSASTNSFFVPGATGSSNAAGTESQQQLTIRSTVTAKHLAAHIAANARTTTTTARTRKNGANGGLTISIGSGATGLIEDTANSDSLAAATPDLWDFEVVTSTGTQSLTLDYIAASLESTDGTQEMVAGKSSSSTFSTSGATQYYKLQGDLAVTGNTTTETAMVQHTDQGGTLTKLRFRIATNSRAVTQTLTLRQNQADTTLTLSVGSSATGMFEDTTHTVNVLGADGLNYALATGASASTCDPRLVAVLFTPTVSLPAQPVRTRPVLMRR